MQVAHLAALTAVLGTLQTVEPRRITGTLSDRLVADNMLAQIELKPSDDRELPRLTGGERIFRARTPQFHPGGSHEGLSIALVEAGDASFLIIDTNLDGRLSEAERTPYTPGSEIAVELTRPNAPSIPFRCRVVAVPDPAARRFLQFTASFRVEGHAEIAGRRTLVSLPYNVGRNLIDLRQGKIGVDVDGDGAIDLRGFFGPEVMFARGDRVIFNAGGTYVSFESADLDTRRFVLREHSAEEYTYIAVVTGASMPDFQFTDFAGRSRKLSEFKGKYVLLDVWGSWCKPCLDDLPTLKEAYDRYHDRGLEIIGIDYEHGASSETVRALLAGKNVTWPNAVPESVRDLVEKRLRIMAFPTLILLDRSGVIVETNSRALRGKALFATLDRHLPAQQSKPAALRTFETVIFLETTSEPSANVSMGDLDGDGDLDIVLAKGRHDPVLDRVLINDGRGRFTASDLGPKADRTYTAALADLDGDGDLDVLTSNDRPDSKMVYLNGGKGRFSVAGTWGMPEWSTRNATVADLNGDGRADVIAANRPGPSFVCLNEGGGSFAAPCIAIPAESATSIVAADFDKDGAIDLAVPSRDGGQSRIYFNDGKAGFARTGPFGPADAAARVAAAADFNRDGSIDLVVGDEKAASVTVYLNDGKGTLTRGFHAADKARTPYAMTAGDLNTDGWPEIVLGYTAGPHSVFFNDGTGSGFTEVKFGDPKGAAYGFALGDIDKDGFPDIALARSGAPNVLYLSKK